MSANPVELLVVLICHWYVIVPAPVPAVVLVKAAGSNGEQRVWSPAIAPGLTVFGVTVNTLLLDEHTTLFKVDLAVLRNQLVVETEGAS